MKITNAEVIKIGEQDLIDAITADLDWGAIEDIFLKEHNIGIEEDIEYKKGDIVAFNNQIAYKLEFEVKVNLSVLLNRDGEYISVSISGDKDKTETGQQGGAPDGSPVLENGVKDGAGDNHIEIGEAVDLEGSMNLLDETKADEPSYLAEEKTDALRDALTELDSDDHHDEFETDSIVTEGADADKKINQMEAHIGEIMDNISSNATTQSDVR